MTRIRNLTWWSHPIAARRLRPFVLSERAALTLVLVVALAQGLLYVRLLPPWQHYDEPTHFEYAWLIANHGHLPAQGEVDSTMRREVAASMLEHGFYHNVPRPDLLADDGEIAIGFSELVHPPAYYALVSLPLRAVRYLDVAQQLYVARGVSLVLLLLTIGVAAGVARELTPAGHLLRWAVPLSLALLPPFVDVMTAVNNDVGSVFAFSLFLWGAVRTIRHGITQGRVAWLVGAAFLGMLTKNTAAMTLPLIPAALAIALWHERGWRWSRPVLASAAAVGVVAVASLGWGDAASWYRWESSQVQDAATRASDPRAPLGRNVLVAETLPNDRSRYLLSPIPAEDVRRLAGHTVTVGGWLWADRPASVGGPGLLVSTQGDAGWHPATHPVSVTTTPHFVAWSVALPPQTGALHYGLFANTVDGSTGPARLMLDGALLVDGERPAGVAPAFDDASGRGGTWGGRHFDNLVRNPSAEQAGPRLRPWLEHLLYRYTRHSPSQVLAALMDTQRTGLFLLGTTLPWLVDGLFGGFAWGQVRLDGAAWPLIFDVVVAIALVGCLRGLGSRSGAVKGRRPALAFLALAALLVWGSALIWPLPMLGAKIPLSGARYTFPAAIPEALLLVGGWWAAWPGRGKATGAGLLLCGLIVLNALSIWTIQAYYAGVVG